MSCHCHDISKWLDILVYLIKDYRQYSLSPASFLYWLGGLVEEPMQRVGNVAPAVVV